MRLLDRLRTRTAAFTHDLLMIPLAWFGAYWLRFNLESIPEPYLGRALEALPVVILVQGGVFWALGLYRGVWRFASIPDLVRILKAVAVGLSLSAVAFFLVFRLQDMPRSVFLLYGMLLVILLGAPRLLYRWAKEHKLRIRDGTRVLIVGAGRAGEMLARDLLRDPGAGYIPVGFVDDDPKKRRREIHGVKVLGYTDSIEKRIRVESVDLILLALPSANSAQMRRIVSRCEATGVPFRTLPRIHDLVSGRSTLNELREVSIEDLLGREPVKLDWASIESSVKDRVVLVSGGGGSIGSELCRQIARLAPARLVVLDNGEYNLYRIDLELRQAYPDLDVEPLLRDVRDRVAVDRTLEAVRPHLVFHAAAYKHVPMLEPQAREAVQNNVLGTRNMALASVEYGVDGFVLISTDKAVNPTNVMGTSKRVAEIFCQNLDRHHPGTRFITVRFGNVLGSAGSVVPLFRTQLAQGGPLTVTHPDIERFFMTIPEACQLIMEAGAVGKGGEVFVLDMGEPVKIRYLAEQMIVLAGKVPGEDVEIVYTGLRPGEKFYEELFHEMESVHATAHQKLLQARYREVDWGKFTADLAALDSACEQYEETAIVSLLRGIVPEFGSTLTQAPANVISIQQAKR